METRKWNYYVIFNFSKENAGHFSLCNPNSNTNSSQFGDIFVGHSFFN